MILCVLIRQILRQVTLERPEVLPFQTGQRHDFTGRKLFLSPLSHPDSFHDSVILYLSVWEVREDPLHHDVLRMIIPREVVEVSTVLIYPLQEVHIGGSFPVPHPRSVIPIVQIIDSRREVLG